MTRTRDDIELDLPFFVNGTLDAPARAETEALMGEDALLATERDALAVIRAQMQSEEHRSPGEFGLARLMRDVDRQETAPRRANRTWVWQAAAAVAVAALLGQMLLTRDDPGSAYQLAGARDAVAVAGTLVVTFMPDASEAAIRAALLDAGVEIVGGPSALGLYRLSPLEGVDPAEAVTSLSAAETIVESVENALD